jgi:hypothetical protein
MAQIFASVSPAMREQFDLRYARKWYARFGLGYYGCCEPLHACIDLLRGIPNLRKISTSAWADQHRMAEQIGSDYVVSRKPSPALLAGDRWDPEAVRADLGETTRLARASGSPLELILKDISTVRYEPQRLWEWADVAMNVVRDGH